MQLGFGQVEDMLSRQHQIDPDKRSAFANRLKHLQKLGFPPGVNTGRGVAAKYEANHLLLLALAIELAQAGYNPERAISLIMGNLERIAKGCKLYFEIEEPVLCFIVPRGLADLMIAEDREKALRLTFLQRENVARDFLRAPKGSYRLYVFSFSGVVDELGLRLSRSEIASKEEFEAALDSWADHVIQEHSDGDT
ncbi:hypothetical protein [Croceicoccus marinus]|uniref:HTH merR-type domain-containing protein n=1 Tax=Croceicoccus marinus TaxID=450378 RepID=A0A7G6VSG1_9SPHN|nr:hypothetical protein [Croceicoccus marinus]QNE04676.1 hypothetical protein H4O24_12025 [Croceicoccus marinus]